MNNIDSTDYQLLLDEIITEFPNFQIKKKSESHLMKAIDIFLKIITFRRMQYFLTSFVTTLGNTVYVPESWDLQTDSSRWITLSHERVHMQQSKDRGRIWFSILYLFCLPSLFAFYRTKFEKEAYEVSIECMLKAYGPAYILNAAIRSHMIQNFTSSSYFWMWVKRDDIEKWYDETVQRILVEEGYDY